MSETAAAPPRAALLWPIKSGPCVNHRSEPPAPAELAPAIGYCGPGLDGLPFIDGDATLGCESELQTAVIGAADAVDLPLTLRNSRFLADLERRAAYDPAPRRLLADLQAYLEGNPGGVWENSWARLPLHSLNADARNLLNHDLAADKGNPHSGPRGDLERFFVRGEGGGEWLRIPISYLVKLALGQWIGQHGDGTAGLAQTARRLMGHFANDNCSPETFSFQVAPYAAEGGEGIARETSKRFLLTHLLLEYANRTFRLLDNGQRATAWFAPQPPLRQRALNDCIPDAFYRELFTNPCLSGWDRGEEKHRYMQLCHEVLSRSQLNAVSKLRDAGIITRNLVVMPNTSNLSLSNNGTHISLGSRRLSALAADPASGFGAAGEKALGDLVIKISEHFLPLFVGTYTAAPYRLPFQDFHPETLLGFLPYQLDYTHLRMLWRSWKKKAHLQFFGHSLTPAGPRQLDRLTASLLHLRGDFVGDFRLLDYLVALAGTEQSPALDGRLGNAERLKRDLADLGVFDQRMSFYQLYKLRERAVHGFSGFEARYYSLFGDMAEDMARAVDLQVLVTALATRYVLEGRITHEHIPDDCFVESERRQLVFASAIGLGSVHLRRGGRNRLLNRILTHAHGSRPSSKYRGYIKIPLEAYRTALLQTLRTDGADLIERLGLESAVDDLERRLAEPAAHAAAGRLTRGILDQAGERDPLRCDAETFNGAAEHYYRDTLKRRYLAEGLEYLRGDLARLQSAAAPGLLLHNGEEWTAFLGRIATPLAQDHLNEADLHRLIGLVLLAAEQDKRESERRLDFPSDILYQTHEG